MLKLQKGNDVNRDIEADTSRHNQFTTTIETVLCLVYFNVVDLWRPVITYHVIGTSSIVRGVSFVMGCEG